MAGGSLKLTAGGKQMNGHGGHIVLQSGLTLPYQQDGTISGTKIHMTNPHAVL